jgi:hypothetical protein
MSILILRGPHAALPEAPLLDRPLRERANAVGQSVHCRAFASVRELVTGLRRARRERTDLLLLDVGDLAMHDASRPTPCGTRSTACLRPISKCTTTPRTRWNHA